MKKTTPTRRKTRRKKGSKLKKFLILLIILVLVLLVLAYLTKQAEEPSTSQTADSANWIEGLELPAPVDGEQQIRHNGYTLSYNEQYEQPSWVAYLLTRDKVNGALERADNFRPDPAVTTGSATVEDYKGSGYDRGHLCPAADQKWSAEAMDDSFYMSNMSPQAPAFNRGIWGDLEATVRTFANDLGAVYVATGPVLSDGPYKTIGRNKVAVPKEYYKAVLYYDGTSTARSIGFLLPNEGSNKDLKDYVVTIDALETKTGLDFFPGLDDKLENETEAVVNVDDWDWRQFTPGDQAKVLVPSQPKKDDSKKQLFISILSQIVKEVERQLRRLL